MLVISDSKSLILPQQQIVDSYIVDNNIKFEARAMQKEISIGDVFDCAFRTSNGEYLNFNTATVRSISRHNEICGSIPSGSLAIVSIEFDVLPDALIQHLGTEEIILSTLVNRNKHNFISKSIALEPVESNRQVLRFLEYLDIEKEGLSTGLCFVARALDGDISVDQTFDIIWLMNDSTSIEACSIKLLKIYDNLFRSTNKLLERIPSIVFLESQIIPKPSIINNRNHLSLNREGGLMLGCKEQLVGNVSKV